MTGSQKWYIRNAWRIVALAVLAAVFAVGIAWTPRGETKSPPPPAPVIPSATKKWFRPSLPLSPSPHDVQAFETSLKNAVIRLAPLPKSAPVKDKQLVEQIEKAREYIESEDQPAALWKSDELHTKLIRLGSEIAIVAPSKEEAENPFLSSYSSRQHAITVWPRAKELHSEKLGQAFLYLATLSLVHAEFMARSGFNADEIDAAQLDCPNLDFLFRFVAEALAYRNEAIWLRRRFEKRLTPMAQLKNPLLIAALENEKGTPEGRKAFADALTQSVGEIPEPICDPPIILKGERKGQYFFPSDIAPGILEPLLEAAR